MKFYLSQWNDKDNKMLYAIKSLLEFEEIEYEVLAAPTSTIMVYDNPTLNTKYMVAVGFYGLVNYLINNQLSKHDGLTKNWERNRKELSEF